MPQYIAIDICNSIADINAILAQVLGPFPDTSKYHHPGATKSFFENNLWIFKEAPPIQGAREVVHYLNSRYQIVYLTARPREAQKITEKWLKRNGFPSAPVVISYNKVAFARKNGLALAIDDAPHEITVLEKVCPVLVPAQPYNIGLGNCRFYWENFEVNINIIEKILAKTYFACAR